MNILFVLPTLGNGGAEKVAAIIAAELSKLNNVEIYTLEFIDYTANEKYLVGKNVLVKGAKVKVKRGNKIKAITSFLFTFFRQRYALKNEIEYFSPDVIISFLPKADFLVSTIKLSVNTKWISSERNDPTRRSIFERAILLSIYKKTNCFVCQTERVAEYYRLHGVKNTVVINNPSNIETDFTYSFPEELNREKKYIISIGRLHKQKNFALLIEAFAAIKNKSIYELIILGSGPLEKKLKKLILNLNVDDKVHLLGRKKNVNDYLRASEFFVMSSDYEGMPNVAIEALAAGLPIISTDYFTGAALELVDDNGFIVPVGDVDKMSKAIEKMIGLSILEIEKMKRSSLSKVVLFDAKVVCEMWFEIIKPDF